MTRSFRPRAPRSRRTRRALAAAAVLVTSLAVALGTTTAPSSAKSTKYPWHTNITATTFWVGEIFDPNASDGSQRISAYDDRWYKRFGGCDGVRKNGDCRTERRTRSNGYFPRHMKPRENPFYLDLPYDDVNVTKNFRSRGKVVPWAGQAAYRGKVKNRAYSLMKNRWVELRKGKRRCYGQIQDAGPGQYSDTRYVFGTKNQRPKNKRYGGAGMDVSPALTGCLGFKSLNGINRGVRWRFVDSRDVPRGPWTRVVTRSRGTNWG